MPRLRARFRVVITGVCVWPKRPPAGADGEGRGFHDSPSRDRRDTTVAERRLGGVTTDFLLRRISRAFRYLFCGRKAWTFSYHFGRKCMNSYPL